MTNYDNWSCFLQEARLLFFNRPLKTKYSVKHVKGEKYVVLKVTDDRKCCKFKLSSSSQLRQLNQLNQLFLNWSLSKEFNSLEDLPLKTEQKPLKSNKTSTSRRA
ncbi:putative signal recognition particle SRP9 subunit [Babesia divergens]|uniref:Signal recognition particle SRP9 subunit n=1 Tax=Babesia divergens TaxID=32595 RepID=A0AAD9GCN7_BABDI|nr:putative signal recognition particle SRP9 subunit [Babesia divergens]